MILSLHGHLLNRKRSKYGKKSSETILVVDQSLFAIVKLIGHNILLTASECLSKCIKNSNKTFYDIKIAQLCLKCNSCLLSVFAVCIFATVM